MKKTTPTYNLYIMLIELFYSFYYLYIIFLHKTQFMKFLVTRVNNLDVDVGISACVHVYP